MKPEKKTGKKRVLITVTAEPYERLRDLIVKAGLPKNYISYQLDLLVQGILPVAEQAYKDAMEKKEMTEEEAKKRYAEIARKEFGKFTE